MQIITIHSFMGSSLESAEPILAYGPFNDEYAEQLVEKLNEFLEEINEIIEMIAFSTLIKYEGPEDQLRDLEEIKEDIKEYWHLDNDFGLIEES